MPKKLRLTVDLDSTVVNLMDPWLEAYNRDHDDSLRLDDIHEWHLHKLAKGGVRIYDYFQQPGWFLNLKPYAGAIAAVRRFVEAGHEVHLVSTPSAAPISAADKLDWVKEHMPFINRRFVTLSAQKHLFLSDVLIDDGPENHQAHAEMQPEAKRIGIAFPYNKPVSHIMHLRAESHHNPQKAWDEIEAFVVDLAADR